MWKLPQIEVLDKFALFPEPLLLGENRMRYGISLAVNHDHQVLLYLLMREHIERVLRRFDNNHYRSVLRDGNTDSLQSVTYVISESMELLPSLGLPVVSLADVLLPLGGRG